ncbi:MAG TPA: carbonic anhydrase [Deltaproteobacteria bacterium]|nr:carbonic anhydrase [Deltaproteobacteria bacterium]
MEDYRRLLLANRMWAKDKLEVDEQYFDGLARGQSPDFLWLGCSDSRVPPDEITGTSPGDIFVHRNIANVVSFTDFNFLSVLEYAVETLKVKHIIVCGHYGCGGVHAALGSSKPGSFLSKWLYNLKAIYKIHKSEIDLHTHERQRWDRLVELNVMEQVQNLARTSIVQRAWEIDQRPALLGWVFNLHDGQLRELVEVQPGTWEDDVYRFEL